MRYLTKTLLLAATILFASAIQSSARQEPNGQSEVQRGFAIAPVQLNLTGKNRSLVGLGSYYVNGPSDCVGCHNGTEGYLGGGAQFGPVQARNLTPDGAGLPASLTLDAFKQVMRSGTDFKGLFPPGELIVMPWPAYQHGTDRWTEAVYEYLRSIPCVEGGPGYTEPRC